MESDYDLHSHMAFDFAVFGQAIDTPYHRK